LGEIARNICEVEHQAIGAESLTDASKSEDVNKYIFQHFGSIT
jgi:hypothetical protein